MGTYPKYVVRRIKLTEMLSCECLFIPSRLSTKSSVGVNPQGRSAKNMKLLLNDCHLEPQAVRPQRHCRDAHLE
jgi:hypothetical protein